LEFLAIWATTPPPPTTNNNNNNIPPTTMACVLTHCIRISSLLPTRAPLHHDLQFKKAIDAELLANSIKRHIEKCKTIAGTSE
jgi:hypothetical protein